MSCFDVGYVDVAQKSLNFEIFISKFCGQGIVKSHTTNNLVADSLEICYFRT
jgi:hypothetical protein